MSRLLAALLGAALLLLSGAPGAAAGTGPGAMRIESADVSRHPEVVLELTAASALAGQLLVAGDFTVTEDGAAREVEAATRSPGAEQEIVLVIDVSGSMAGAFLSGAKAAASEFVARAPDGARIAVVAFGSQVSVVSELTADKQALTGSIAALEAAGETALFDAVSRAADLLATGNATTGTIIVLSDGEDTASQGALSTAGERVAAAGASLYGIQLGVAADGSGELASLVTSVAGTMLTASDAAGLAAAYEALAVNSGNRYTLTYRSESFGPTGLDLGISAFGVDERVSNYRLDLPERAATETDEPSEEPAVAVVERPDTLVEPASLASSWALWAGLAACYAALAVVTVLIFRRSRQVSADRRNPLSTTKISRLTASTDRVSGLIDRILRRGGWSPIRTTALERAGLTLRREDFILIVGAAAMAAAAASLLLGGPLVALFAAIATPFVAKLFLKFRASRRQAKFADQLDDSLQLLAGSLRAGHSLLRGISAVSTEAEAPTSEEFARILNETRLGRDLGQALDHTAARMDSDDFVWAAQAIAIHREVGGNLAEVLDAVGHTIRERNEIRRQVKALSAEGKLSAIILMGLPFGITGFLYFANPAYIMKLTESLLGYAMLGAAALLLTVGGLWLRKVVSFQF